MINKRLALLLVIVATITPIHVFAGDFFKNTQLKNGLEIIYMESHKAPLVTIVLSCKAGGLTETPETDGLTHLWEHMFFKGNQRLKNQEAFQKRVRELGIIYNGDTSAEKVRYYFTLPSVYIDEGLQFMADAISTPLIDQQELEKERKVVLNEWDRSASQPSFDLGNLIEKMVYGDQSYQRDPLGSRDIIENATKEQLLQIKDEVFTPANCALLVSGDFDEDNLIRMSEAHFKKWRVPDGWRAVKRPPFPPFPETAEFVMTRKRVDNASLSVLYSGPKARELPQDTYVADALISLLTHRSGRFYKKFIDSGLSLSAGLSYYTQSQTGEIRLYAKATPKKIVAVKTALLDEIKQWTKADYFTQEQLEDIKRQLLIGHKMGVNKPSAYIKTLAFWWPVTGLDYYENYLDNMQKVTLADIQQFVKTYLIGKPSVTSIFLSPQSAKEAGLNDSSAMLMKKYFKNNRAEKKQ